MLCLSVLGVVFTTLSAVQVAEWLLVPINEKRKLAHLSARQALRKSETEEEAKRQQARILEALDSLSTRELEIVVKCLTEGSPSFVTYHTNPAAGTLSMRQLIATPIGQVHMDHCPFVFRDFVWRGIQERKDEYLVRWQAHVRSEQEAQRTSARLRR